MIRSGLILMLIDENPDLTRADVEALVDTFFNRITGNLAAGGRVEIRGFGVFTTRVRDARRSRDPRNGDRIDVAAKRVVHFRAGKEMYVRLNC
jgi:integration host factor subunit beta